MQIRSPVPPAAAPAPWENGVGAVLSHLVSPAFACGMWSALNSSIPGLRIREEVILSDSSS